MPELPEVETVRKGLQALLLGRRIATVDYNNEKSFPNSEEDVAKFLVGAEILQVKRRAKVLLVELSTKYSLVVHLKMTGQLVVRLSSGARFGAGHPSGSLVGELPDRSTHVIITFTEGSKLFFNDQRKFGWMRLLPTAEVSQIDFFKKVGPEPLSREFTWKMMQERLTRRPNMSIKAALLDQSVIAGIGNIYADESLWGAKIHPSTVIKKLTDVHMKRLHRALITVLRLAIQKGGSTDKNYVNVDGKRGSYLTFASVYRRENLPCPRCGCLIIKIRVAGRGTHICSCCQVQG